MNFNHEKFVKTINEILKGEYLVQGIHNTDTGDLSINDEAMRNSTRLSPEEHVELGELRPQIIHNWQRPLRRHNGYVMDIADKGLRKWVTKAKAADARKLASPSTVHYKIKNEALDIIIPTMRRNSRRIFTNNFFNSHPPHKSMFVEWDNAYLLSKLGKVKGEFEPRIQGVWIQEASRVVTGDKTEHREKKRETVMGYTYDWFGQLKHGITVKEGWGTTWEDNYAKNNSYIYETYQEGMNLFNLAFHDQTYTHAHVPTNPDYPDREFWCAYMFAPFMHHFSHIATIHERFNIAKSSGDILLAASSGMPNLEVGDPYSKALSPDEITMLSNLAYVDQETASGGVIQRPLENFSATSGYSQEYAENYPAISQSAIGWFTTLTNIISLINQPWAVIEEEGITARGTKSVAENINKGQQFKVVTLNVPQDKAIKLFNKTKVRTRKFGTAEHTVRGHYRTYKKTGETIWIDEHARGDAKYGTVHKDYEVVKREGLLKPVEAKKERKK